MGCRFERQRDLQQLHALGPHGTALRSLRTAALHLGPDRPTRDRCVGAGARNRERAQDAYLDLEAEYYPARRGTRPSADLDSEGRASADLLRDSGAGRSARLSLLYERAGTDPLR